MEMVRAQSPFLFLFFSYLKYPLFVGGNRGRGQVYADGSKSNNTVYTASTAGKIQSININQKGEAEINCRAKEHRLDRGP
mgnify:CR=1 FL=1